MSADQAARAAADNRKMHLETLRQQSLMYPTSAILTVWREGIEAALAEVARLTRERDALRAACELTLRWLRGEVIERSVRDAIAEALAPPGDGAPGGGRG
jgi:hypothetical protein